MTKCKIQKITAVDPETYDVFLAGSNNLECYSYIINQNGKASLTILVNNKPGKYTWFWTPVGEIVDGDIYIDEDGNLVQGPDKVLFGPVAARGTINETAFTFDLCQHGGGSRHI